METENIVGEVRRNGYAKLPQVFTKSEVGIIKNKLGSYIKKVKVWPKTPSNSI